MGIFSKVKKAVKKVATVKNLTYIAPVTAISGAVVNKSTRENLIKSPYGKIVAGQLSSYSGGATSGITNTLIEQYAKPAAINYLNGNTGSQPGRETYIAQPTSYDAAAPAGGEWYKNPWTLALAGSVLLGAAYLIVRR